MPALTNSEAELLRHPHVSIRRYLSVCPRTPVFQAVVSGIVRDSQTNGIVALDFNNVTLGRYTAALPGLTIDVGSTPGARDRGIFRSRKTPTSSRLFVNETAPATVPVQVGDWLTVREERLIWQKLPYLVAQKSSGALYYDSFELRVDYEVNYTNEHKFYRPLANVTGQIAGWADPQTGWRTVRLSANDPQAPSMAIAKGASITGYEWVLFDGVLEDGYSKYDPVIEARFPASRLFRYIGLIVTDSNGVDSTRYFPIFVHSEAHPPLTYRVGFDIERDDTNIGREMEIVLYGPPEAVNEKVLPRGTLIVYWEDAQFAGQEAPASYRRQFMGWTMRDALELRGYTGRYRVSVGGPAQWLSQLSGIQESFLRRSNPTRWYHMKDITDNRGIASLLRYRSTALDVCNLVPSDTTYEWGQPDTSDFAALKIDKGSLWDQITFMANEMSAVVKADSSGTIWVRPNPCLLPSGRDNVVTTLSLTARDWKEEEPLSYPTEYLRPAGSLTVDGFYWNGSESVPLRAKAPGKAPDYGVVSESVPTQVLGGDNQTAAENMLKALTGHWLAWLNNPHRDLSLTLICPLDVIEPAWGEWLVINSDVPTVRGTILSGTRFLVDGVSISHQPEAPYKIVSLQLSQETSGQPGEIVPIPSSDVLPDDWDYPDDWYPFDWGVDIPDEGQFWLYAGLNAIAAFGQKGYLYRTANFMSETPTWEAVFLNLAGEVLCFVVDPFSPGYVGSGAAIAGWLATTQALYKVNNIFGTPSISLLISWGYTIETPNYDVTTVVGMDASFGVPNHVVVAIPANPSAWVGGIKTYYTRDGTNFTAVSIPWTGTYHRRPAPAVYVSPRTAGLVYVTAPYNEVSVGLFISTNYGASYSRSTSHGPRHPFPSQLYKNGSDVLHVPYDSNPNESDLYYRRMDDNDSLLYRLKNGVSTNITPVFGSTNKWAPNRCRWGGMTAPLDRRRLAYVGSESWNGKLFLSTNEGDSWVEQSAIRGYLRQVAIAGDNPNAIYAWGHNWDSVYGFRPYIWYSSDWGSNWQDKRGNLPSIAANNESLIGICGGPAV